MSDGSGGCAHSSVCGPAPPLLLRLAADTGARRGELAALRTDELTGRRLRIERGLSDEVLTSTKTGRARSLTLATGTATLWHDTVGTWQNRRSAARTVAVRHRPEPPQAPESRPARRTVPDLLPPPRPQ